VLGTEPVGLTGMKLMAIVIRDIKRRIVLNKRICRHRRSRQLHAQLQSFYLTYS
jgi:hypothetical protein